EVRAEPAAGLGRIRWEWVHPRRLNLPVGDGPPWRVAPGLLVCLLMTEWSGICQCAAAASTPVTPSIWSPSGRPARPSGEPCRIGSGLSNPRYHRHFAG